jgi:hypothetical protein
MENLQCKCAQAVQCFILGKLRTHEKHSKDTNTNKTRPANFFWNFSRHPLLIWLHCCFHHYKTLKAVGTATVAVDVLTPANFFHFRRPKFNFQPLSFTFGKKLAETKTIARVNVKKSKEKKMEKKAFKLPAMKRQRFLPKFVNNSKIGSFLAAAEALLKCCE